MQQVEVQPPASPPAARPSEGEPPASDEQPRLSSSHGNAFSNSRASIHVGKPAKHRVRHRKEKQG